MTTISEIRAHLTACSSAFYPGGGGTPDATICRADQLGMIYPALVATHGMCVTAANVAHCRRDQDYAAGGVRAEISQKLYAAGLNLVAAQWAAAVEAYIAAAEVVAEVAARKAAS